MPSLTGIAVSTFYASFPLYSESPYLVILHDFSIKLKKVIIRGAPFIRKCFICWEEILLDYYFTLWLNTISFIVSRNKFRSFVSVQIFVIKMKPWTYTGSLFWILSMVLVALPITFGFGLLQAMPRAWTQNYTLQIKIESTLRHDILNVLPYELAS